MTNCIWRSRRALRAESAHIKDSIHKDDNEFSPEEFWRKIEILRNPALAPPKPPEELTRLITALQKTREFLVQNGYISEDILFQLDDLYPADEPGFDTLHGMNAKQVDGRYPIPKDLSLPDITNDEKAQRMAHMLKLIDDDIKRAEIRIRKADIASQSSEKPSREEVEAPDNNNQIGLHAIPEKHIGQHILWYEMRLDRQFNRALNQLLKLQERRMKYDSENDQTKPPSDCPATP